MSIIYKEKQEEKELLKPKVDVVFHALFREENKELTEGLISDIIGEKVKIKTTDLNRYLDIKVAEQKLGIMDLRTELEDGTKCNIEIQLEVQKNENKRFLYYWADSYARQLRRGEEYNSLHKTISIIILDHCIKELKGIEELDTKWQIRDSKTGKRILTDDLEIIIVEIPKAIRQYRRNEQDKICQWMLFFDDPNKEELKEVMEENEKIKEAVEELREMSEDEELRILAELREKGRRDENARREYAVEEGLREGRERGMKEGLEEGKKQGKKQGIKEGLEKGKREIAKNMLKEGIKVDVISKVTGLNEEEIKQIKNQK